MIEEDRKTFKLTFEDQRRIIDKKITLLDLVVEKQEEIEKLKKELTEEKNAYIKMYNMYVEKDNIIKKAIEYMDRRDLEWGSDEHDKMIGILKGVDKG